jgi:hypothetical protein
MVSTIYVVRKKKEYREEWDSEDLYQYKGKAIEAVSRANLSDAIRASAKLRHLSWGRTSSAGYEEAQEIITRMSKGIYEVVERRVNDRYS